MTPAQPRSSCHTLRVGRFAAESAANDQRMSATDGEHLAVAVRVHAVKNFPRRFFQHGQVLPVSEVCGQVVPLNHLLIAHPGFVMTPPRHRHKMRARALSLARSLALYPSFPLS